MSQNRSPRRRRFRRPQFRRFWLWAILLVLLAGGYSFLGILVPGLPLLPAHPAEVEVREIPLRGPMAGPKAEGSGLAWYKDTLILLPQYPRRMSDFSGGSLLALSRAEIEDYLDGKSSGPLEPKNIRLSAGNMQKFIPGFEGFEAITFAGDQVFALIEAHDGVKMKSYIARGSIQPDLQYLYLDEDNLTEIPLDRQLPNLSNEALTVDGDRLLIFYEANGSWINPSARAYRYTFDLQPDGTVDMPNLPYRLTDASALDAQGRFWVMNFFYPPEFYLFTLNDPLAREFGRGPSQSLLPTTERIVQLQAPAKDGVSITYTSRPPVQIKLEGLSPRNWEGLVVLEDRGFLILTDRTPGTIFGFVPFE